MTVSVQETTQGVIFCVYSTAAFILKTLLHYRFITFLTGIGKLNHHPVNLWQICDIYLYVKVERCRLKDTKEINMYNWIKQMK